MFWRDIVARRLERKDYAVECFLQLVFAVLLATDARVKK
jgi:hypothetical protein